MNLTPQQAMRAAVAVPGVPRDEDGPVFREPWEARAFAMALALHEAGVFTWKEWAETLHRYRDAWDNAADRTPHGMPIELTPADFGR